MRYWQNKSDQWILFIKAWDFCGGFNSNYDGELVIINEYYYLNKVIDQQEELHIDGGGGVGGINLLVSETAMVNKTKGWRFRAENIV